MRRGDEDEEFWTIEELGGRVAEALSVGYRGVPSGRVRDVPDLRTIRYYTTLGLLDRPAEMRGRTALYGRRHLLQLVAIKRLQAQGLSLAEIQRSVVGLTDAALRRVADPSTPEEAPRSRRESSFWSDPPGPLAGQVEVADPIAASPAPVRGDDDEQGRANPTLPQVVLGAGVTLSLPTRRRIDDEDLRVIRMAAAPLIELLTMRGLIGPGPEGESR